MKKKLIALCMLLSLLLCGCAEITVEYIPLETDDYMPQTQPTTQEEQLTEGNLTVHFIDVGQADCALVEAGGEYMLIDGGNRDDGQLVVSYLQQQGVEELAAVVCTHAHEDHVGGLPSVLAVYPTAAVYAPTKTYSSRIFDDFLYYTDQQGLEVTIPQPGDTMTLGGAEVTVLGPVMSYPEPNDTSIVLRLDYGDTAFLFTGDMEKTAENDMLDYWEARGYDNVVSADVLKVGHHCSDTSTGYRFLYMVEPEYGIISCEKNNSYGHPHDEPLSRLMHAGVTCFRTDVLGHVIATSDGREVSFIWEKQSAQPEGLELGDGMTYIGNKNSKTFHASYCDSLPSKKNQVELESVKAAMAEGYTPCRSCLG